MPFDCPLCPGRRPFTSILAVNAHIQSNPKIHKERGCPACVNKQFNNVDELQNVGLLEFLFLVNH